ncbi:cell-wall biogenesis glycosyltransferase [Streptococcus pneumoniae]|nr:cell-wall biogenesis glycosyltransferase [Streptococcus pneumoniae]
MIMNNVKLSIIIPVRNAENSIERCINSLLNQTVKDGYEIIVVDNNSKDRTRMILEKFDNIKIIQNKNQGSYSSRNLGITIAQGELLFFTDSDCIAQNDLIEKIFECDQNYKFDIIQGQSLHNYTKNEVSDMIQFRYNDIFFTDILVNHPFCSRIDTRNCIINKKIFEQFGGFDDECILWGDLDFGYKLVESGYQIFYNNKIVIYHENIQELNEYISKIIKEGNNAFIYLRRKGKTFAYNYFKELLFIFTIKLRFDEIELIKEVLLLKNELESQIAYFHNSDISKKYLVFKKISEIAFKIGVLEAAKKEYYHKD